MKHLPMSLKIALLFPIVGLFVLIPLAQTLDYQENPDKLKQIDDSEIVFGFHYLLINILIIIPYVL